MKKTLYTLSIAILGGLVAISINQLFIHENVVPSVQHQVTQPDDFEFQLTAQKPKITPIVDFTHAAKVSTPSVVHIKSYKQVSENQYQNPFWQLFGEAPAQIQQKPIQSSSGSGVILCKDGFIITNNHVIDGADKIDITLDDNRLVVAKVVGTYPPADLALLKIDLKDLPFLEFGEYDELDVGEWILAVGNPFNLTSTVTAGIVSAKARDINIIESTYAIESFIQTDAAVNPGNSGGALVNLEGKLVGINTAILSKTGSYAGYSFAIPVTIVQKVYQDLKDYGVVQRGLIGVSIQSVDAGLIERENLKTTNGVYVKQVIIGAAAEAAGIKKGDVIIQINDSEIKKTAELQEEISKYRPNDKIDVVINRFGEIKTISVTLRNIDGETAIIKKSDIKGHNLYGAYFKNATAIEKQNLRLANGVKIIKMDDGVFRDAQIKLGFIITHVERIPVKDANHLVQLLKGKKDSGGVLLQGIYPNGRTAYYGIGI